MRKVVEKLATPLSFHHADEDEAPTTLVHEEHAIHSTRDRLPELGGGLIFPAW